MHYMVVPSSRHNALGDGQNSASTVMQYMVACTAQHCYAVHGAVLIMITRWLPPVHGEMDGQAGGHDCVLQLNIETICTCTHG